MKLLLDTHAMYWYIEGDAKLSATAETLIRDATNEILHQSGLLLGDRDQGEYWEVDVEPTV